MLRRIHDPERGASFVEYAGVLVLAAAIVAAVAFSGIAGQVSEAVVSAVEAALDGDRVAELLRALAVAEEWEEVVRARLEETARAGGVVTLARVEDPGDLLACLVSRDPALPAEALPWFVVELREEGRPVRLEGRLDWAGEAVPDLAAAVRKVYPTPQEWRAARAAGTPVRQDRRLRRELGLVHSVREWSRQDCRLLRLGEDGSLLRVAPERMRGGHPEWAGLRHVSALLRANRPALRALAAGYRPR